MKNSGQFKPGKSGNPAGRPKGSKNRNDLRKRVEKLIDQHFDVEKLNEDLENLDAKDRLNFFLRLLEFTLPKMRAVEYSSELETLSEEDLDRIINRLMTDNYEQN
jgi:hypothetical protein